MRTQDHQRFEDFRGYKDKAARLAESQQVEDISFDHALGQATHGAHAFTLRFIGVVPADSLYIPDQGGRLKQNPNCVDARYINMLYTEKTEEKTYLYWVIQEPGNPV